MSAKPKPRRRPERWLSMSELLERFLANPPQGSNLGDRARRDQLAYIRRQVDKQVQLDAEGWRLTKKIGRRFYVNASVLEPWLPQSGDYTEAQTLEMAVEKGLYLGRLVTGQQKIISDLVKRVEILEKRLGIK